MKYIHSTHCGCSIAILDYWRVCLKTSCSKSKQLNSCTMLLITALCLQLDRKGIFLIWIVCSHPWSARAVLRTSAKRTGLFLCSFRLFSSILFGSLYPRQKRSRIAWLDYLCRAVWVTEVKPKKNATRKELKPMGFSPNQSTTSELDRVIKHVIRCLERKHQDRAASVAWERKKKSCAVHSCLQGRHWTWLSLSGSKVGDVAIPGVRRRL